MAYANALGQFEIRWSPKHFYFCFVLVLITLKVNYYHLSFQILDLLGPKTEADLAPAPKPDKKSKSGDSSKKVKEESQGNN